MTIEGAKARGQQHVSQDEVSVLETWDDDHWLVKGCKVQNTSVGLQNAKQYLSTLKSNPHDEIIALPKLHRRVDACIIIRTVHRKLSSQRHTVFLDHHSRQLHDADQTRQIKPGLCKSFTVSSLSRYWLLVNQAGASRRVISRRGDDGLVTLCEGGHGQQALRSGEVQRQMRGSRGAAPPAEAAAVGPRRRSQSQAVVCRIQAGQPV